MRVLLLFALAFGMAGCTTVYFDQPQPPQRWNKKAFPKSWQGHWIPEGATSDTIQIGAQWIDIQIDEDPQHLILGEDVVLRSFAGHLVVSLLEKEENGYVVRIAKRTGDVIDVFEMDGKDEAKVVIWEDALGTSISRTTSASGEVKSYRLAPENNAAFRDLIRQGGFTLTEKLRRAVD